HSFRSLTGLSITDQQTQLKNMLGQEIQSPILIYPDGKVVESKNGLLVKRAILFASNDHRVCSIRALRNI
ncbi:hypothetical protein D5E84_25205, partial [Vibrio parahaemolyticus]